MAEDELERALAETAQAEEAAEGAAEGRPAPPVMSQEEREFQGRMFQVVTMFRQGKGAFGVLARGRLAMVMIRPDVLRGVSFTPEAPAPEAMVIAMNADMVGGLVRGLVQGLREADPEGATFQFGPAPGEEPRIVVPNGITFPRGRRDS